MEDGRDAAPMLPCCGAANVEAAMKLLAIIALGTVLAATVAQRLSDQIVGGLANAETIQAASGKPARTSPPQAIALSRAPASEGIECRSIIWTGSSPRA